MNKSTLVPEAHKLTPEERSLGGTNSAISRKAKKRALEIAREILSLPVDEGDPVDVSEISSLKDTSEVTLDVMSSILAKISQRALNGDLKASKLLLEISGDYTARQEVKIGTEDDYSDIDFHIVIGAPDRSEATFFDKDGKRIRTIYGKEAQDLYFEKMKAGELKDDDPLEIAFDEED